LTVEEKGDDNTEGSTREGKGAEKEGKGRGNGRVRISSR
jgi:hypothetical protein